jgi:hypothetical protein
MEKLLYVLLFLISISLTWSLIPVESKFESQVLELKNGLLIQQYGQIAVEQGTWKVFVHYDAPNRNHWEQVIRKLRETIDVFAQGHSRANNTLWYRKLRDLILLHESKTRVKRGWFNIIGRGLRTVFGTATVAQIDEVKALIAKVQTTSSAQVHFVDQMASVVNKNQKDIHDTRERLTELVARSSVLTDWIESSLHVAINRSDHMMNELYLELHLQGLFDSVEIVTMIQVNQEQNYERLKASLELGRLTEELWSVDTFELLSNDLPPDLLFENPTWYYQNVKAQTLSVDEETLIWSIELPLKGSEIFDKYLIQTFPVPFSDYTTSIKILLPTILGFNPKTGMTVENLHCMGQENLICKNNVRRLEPKDNCFGGIFLNDETAIRTCPAEVLTGNLTQISQTDTNVFVLQTFGEIIREKCQGLFEKKFILPKGVYLIELAETCEVRTRDFSLQRIREIATHMTFNFSKVLPINFEIQSIVHEGHIKQLPDVHFKPLKETNVVTLGKMPTSKPEEWFEWQVPHASLIGGGSFTIFLVVVVIGVILCKYKQCSRLVKRVRQNAAVWNQNVRIKTKRKVREVVEPIVSRHEIEMNNLADPVGCVNKVVIHPEQDEHAIMFEAASLHPKL